MKLNAATILWLIIGLAGLVASYTQGIFEAHPAVLMVALGAYKVLGSLLGPLASKELPKP